MATNPNATLDTDTQDFRECDGKVEVDLAPDIWEEVPCNFRGDVDIEICGSDARWKCPRCETEHDEDVRDWYV